MSRIPCGLVAVLFVLSAGPTRAAIEPLPDAISTAYYAALKALRDGDDRQKIAEKLGAVLDKNADLNSPYKASTASFHKDLVWSAKNPPPAGGAAEKRLAESQFEFGLIRSAARGEKALADAIQKAPKDPATELLAADRKVIERLLPALRDRSPTRCQENAFVRSQNHWQVPQPRVCDLALGIIEYHSQCEFHHDRIQGSSLHQLPEDKFDDRVRSVEAWWKENKDKSVAAGIRAYLPKAATYPETAAMAQNLIRAAKPNDADATFARDLLLATIKANPRHHVSAHYANALAEAGDTSAVEFFREEMAAGGECDASVTFYLMKHGGRKEWEALHARAAAEVKQGGRQPLTGVLGDVVRNSSAKHPYAIPLLALALDAKHADELYKTSLAETAVQKLQPVKDFAYSVNGTSDEKFAVVRRAEAWWKDEGAAKYTFAAIEKAAAKKP